MIELMIDGTPVTVDDDATILQAMRSVGKNAPTLCFLDNLTPVNVCRACVVEVEGSRTLVPSCSRRVEPGMRVRTRSERVDHSRRMVVELLASTVDLSTAPLIQAWVAEYGAEPSRYGADAVRYEHPLRADNEQYVRDYSKCILCYRCVEACGEDAQFTFALAVAGRGFHAHIDTGGDTPLLDSRCVFCGNCVGVCPTGALMPTIEHNMRRLGSWDEAKQRVVTTTCSYCGVGCQLDLHVQDNKIVKVTSPLDHSVGHGHLCIKGRYGFTFVNGDEADEAQPPAKAGD